MKVAEKLAICTNGEEHAYTWYTHREARSNLTNAHQELGVCQVCGAHAIRDTHAISEDHEG